MSNLLPHMAQATFTEGRCGFRLTDAIQHPLFLLRSVKLVAECPRYSTGEDHHTRKRGTIWIGEKGKIVG
jgi:hypothetical protein